MAQRKIPVDLHLYPIFWNAIKSDNMRFSIWELG